MLFGRLRVPYERLAAEPRGARSARRVGSSAMRPCGDSPRRPVGVGPARASDEYAGLERLDREELDEAEPDGGER